MDQSNPAILVLRDAVVRNGNNSFDIIRNWVATAFPDFSPDFRVLELPGTIDEWDGIRVLVNWTLDPVKLWSDAVYEQISRLQQDCDGRGIPVINRVDRQINAGKFQAAQAVTTIGLRTPRSVLIKNHAEFLQDYSGVKFPLMVRENWGHQGKILRVERPEEISEENLKGFANPVAIEIIDVRNPDDGWYRMRRYLASGPMGISLFSKRAQDWVVRDNVADTSTDAEEEHLRYTGQEDPNHEKFQSIARLLGLDVLAFDYSLDQDGEVVVWEVNPYTRLRFVPEESLSRITPAQRGAAAMVSLCRMRAGLPVNSRMLRYLGYAAHHVIPASQ